MTSPPIDADSPWKEALERYLQPCLALFLPQAHAEIDWSSAPQFLDNELRQVVRDAETGVRRVDRLVQVWLLDGSDAWVLIHIEVQAQEERAFAERMYIYNYRIFDRYRREVVSLAVLAEDRAGGRPGEYLTARWGCRTRFEYPVVRLRDWQARREALEADDNPFATIVLAHLAALETRHDAVARTQAKVGLVRRLYERGYERQEVLDLFRFVDWLLALPAAGEAVVWQEITRIEEERKMPYITSVERRGLERGLEQGRQEGLQEGKRATLRRLVQVRFGTLPEALDARITAADETALEALIDRVLTVATAEDL